MWELDYKEGWAPKNWCFWTAVLEKTLESPLDCKEIQLVHSKGDQSWVFIRRTDAEAETPIVWPPDMKNWRLGKDCDVGKDWRPEEKGTTKDEMVGWYHQLDGHEFEQASGVGDGRGSLACCSPRGCKQLDTTEQLNQTEHFQEHPPINGDWETVDKCSSLPSFRGSILGSILDVSQEIPVKLSHVSLSKGFPSSSSDKEPSFQCRRHKRQGFHLWVGKIPWRKAWQPTPVFLSGESHRQRSLAGYSP